MADVNSSLDKLKEMLSDPQKAEKIAPIIDMFMSSYGGEKKSAPKQSEPTPEPEQEQEPESNVIKPVFANQNVRRDDTSSGLSMDTVMKVKNMYDQVNSHDDKRINLLMAIKPYLRETRINKLDTAVKILKATKIGSAMKNMDQF